MKSLLTIALTTALCAACGGSTPPAVRRPADDRRHGGQRSPLCATGGRTGAWFVIDDGTSTNISPRGEFAQNLIPGGRDASRYAAHMTGFGFTDWGAAMGLSLDGDGQPYDASPTSGVRFWMKSNVPVAVGFPIPERRHRSARLPRAWTARRAGTATTTSGSRSRRRPVNGRSTTCRTPQSRKIPRWVPPAARQREPRPGIRPGSSAFSSTWTPSRRSTCGSTTFAFTPRARLAPVFPPARIGPPGPRVRRSARRRRGAGRQAPLARRSPPDLPGVWGTASTRLGCRLRRHHPALERRRLVPRPERDHRRALCPGGERTRRRLGRSASTAPS